MTIHTNATLNKAIENGEASTCIPVGVARIIIPTDCPEVVGFTNPDDIDPRLGWEKGKSGPEFENQKLMPGDCLVMYDNGRNMREVLEEDPNWYKTPEGIKKTIEKLYDYVDEGGKNGKPAIWNSHFGWAEKVSLTTTSGELVTAEMWKEKAGQALSVIKKADKQYFVHIKPGDQVILSRPGSKETTLQTAGAMSAIAVKQPDDTWNIVQLSAKGYEVVDENIKTAERTLDTNTKNSGRPGGDPRS